MADVNQGVVSMADSVTVVTRQLLLFREGLYSQLGFPWDRDSIMNNLVDHDTSPFFLACRIGRVLPT